MSKYVVQAGWDHAPHLSERAKADLLKEIPLHQRDARTKGVPMLGRGAIYPVPEEDFIVPAFAIPEHFPRGYGLDVGWNRTAAIWGARDLDSDTLYLYAEHYAGEQKPPMHAAAIKGKGEWIPGRIDPAARGRGQVDGEQLLQNYIDLGLNLEPADNAVEAGIHLVLTRLVTGRLKVFAHLVNWLAEFRRYQRDKTGKVKKGNDHAMDATRYLVTPDLDFLRTHVRRRIGPQIGGVFSG
jgi:Terminase RNaseH-like domain